MVRRKKTKQFKPGHIVRLTGEFMRNTGQFVGAPINGRVEALQPFGKAVWPVVLWSDADEPRLVNPANIELDPRARRINEQVGLSGGFGATPRGIFARCHPVRGATGVWHSDNAKWQVNLREATMTPEGVLVLGSVDMNKPADDFDVFMWDHLENADVLDIYAREPGEADVHIAELHRFLAGRTRKMKKVLPQYILDVVRQMIRVAHGCVYTGSPGVR
jgi:hypothetical protein